MPMKKMESSALNLEVGFICFCLYIAWSVFSEWAFTQGENSTLQCHPSQLHCNANHLDVYQQTWPFLRSSEWASACKDWASVCVQACTENLRKFLSVDPWEDPDVTENAVFRMRQAQIWISSLLVDSCVPWKKLFLSRLQFPCLDSRDKGNSVLVSQGCCKKLPQA